MVTNVSMRKAGKRNKKAERKLSGTPDKSGKISWTGKEESGDKFAVRKGRQSVKEEENNGMSNNMMSCKAAY